MSGATTTTHRAGFFGWVRRIDDAVFAVEQTLVSYALLAMATFVFLDVVSGTLVSQDSKVGKLLAKLASIEDPATRAWIDANLAPWVALVGSFLLLALAFHQGRARLREQRGAAPRAPSALDRAMPWIFSAVAIGAGYAIGWAILTLESKHVYIGLFVFAGGGIVIHQGLRRQRGWIVRIVSAIASTIAAILFAIAYFPIGYSWAQELSLMLVLWVGFLGASICAHEGKHLQLEALAKLIPDRAKPYVRALGLVVAAGFCLLLVVQGFDYTFRPTPSDDPELPELFVLFGTRYVAGFGSSYQDFLSQTQVPAWYGTVVVPIALCVAMLRFLGGAVSSVLGGRYGAPAAEEGMEEARKIAAEKERTRAGDGAKSEEESEAAR